MKDIEEFNPRCLQLVHILFVRRRLLESIMIRDSVPPKNPSKYTTNLRPGGTGDRDIILHTPSDRRTLPSLCVGSDVAGEPFDDAGEGVSLALGEVGGEEHFEHFEDRGEAIGELDGRVGLEGDVEEVWGTA